MAIAQTLWKNAFALSLALILAVLSACSSAPSPKPSVGTLEVNITGLPVGVSASVTVSGPGFSQTLTASKTLSALAPGNYSLSSANVTASGTSYSASITGSPATITAGATATANVLYAAQAQPNPPAPPTAQTGSLQVNVSGLPSGTDAKVSVSGPNGFSQTLTASKILSGLVPGSYSVAAASVTSGTATYTSSVSGSPAAVAGGTTSSVGVVYAAQAPGVGSLQVNISGLLFGAKAEVVVKGPGGFTQTLTASSLLGNLTPGSYTLEKRTVRLVAPIVDWLFEATGPDSVNLTAGGSASAQVTYAPRPGSPALWLPTGSLRAYSYKLLGFGGTSGALPTITLNTPAGGSNQAVAFDAKGNLWTLNSSSNTLLEFSATQLGQSGSPTPAVSISSSAGSLNRPAALAFDVSGNLWVANLGNDTIVMYTAYQLANVTNPTPGLVISANTSGLVPSLHGVSSLAFDKSGNLWVLNGASPETIVRFTPDQLMQSGMPVPAITLSPTLSAGSNIAFDAGGNLWVSDYGSSAILKYSAAGLAQPGGPSPVATIHSMNNSLSNPAGLAFDSSGNLWVANVGNNTLVEFAADQLPTSPSADSPEASSIITGVAGLSWGSIAFNPAPLGLPLAH